MVVNQATKWRDPKECIDVATTFLKDALEKSECEGYVVGLSGGLDSTVAAILAKNAVGERVKGYNLYENDSDDLKKRYIDQEGKNWTNASLHELIIDIKRLLTAESIKIPKDVDAWFDTKIKQTPVERPFEPVDTSFFSLSKFVHAYSDQFSYGKIRRGNFIARLRMIMLFDRAHYLNALVLGTGNRTEICLGYTTWYGDSACSVNPLAPFYKTEVRAMAKELDVPQEIIDATPTAGLWEGQTDEGEIGVDYETIDNILHYLMEGGTIDSNFQELYALYGEKNVRRVVELLNKNWFKRHLPQTPPCEPIPDRIDLP